MTQTRWAVDGPDDVSLELGGRKFSSNDEGAPMMCNLVCSSMGRHVHIDYCRTEANEPCDGAEVQHVNSRIDPNPDRPKDAVTHSLYWRRMGFKDPYTRGEQANFVKCDTMCPGAEHLATDIAPAQPSYCTLPMFHPPQNTSDPARGVLGYVSHDGHMFSCRNPAILQPAFHVIFIIDKSSSMSRGDRQPLPDAPATNRIREKANNRLGAVYSALHGFWSARHAAVTSSQQAIGARRDAYSIILFDSTTKNAVVNDFTSDPDQLLDIVLNYKASGNTNFTAALQAGQATMIDNWSTERTPVMVFLSDGQSSVQEKTVIDLCWSAIQHGKPLSFHAGSFGPNGDSASSSLNNLSLFPSHLFGLNTPTTTLRNMVQTAFEIQNKAPADPLSPAATSIASFNTALDTVSADASESHVDISGSLMEGASRGNILGDRGVVEKAKRLIDALACASFNRTVSSRDSRGHHS